MKISLRLICLVAAFSSIVCQAKYYDVSLSTNYLKIELHNWSNFTVHIQAKGNVYSSNIVMEVNHTDDTNVSPKSVEIHTKNFSSWCHMFHVYACKPGSSRIHLNVVNGSLRNETEDLYIDVDIVRMKALELYGSWCRKYFYIFSILSVYPQIFMQFLRLSVVGLDMDYVCFNFISHLSYGVYTLFMYTQTDVYVERNPEEDFPVTITENMFALHGFIISVILGIQAVKYFGVDKRITVLGKELISFYGIVFTFGFLLAKFHIIQYLDFLYISKYIHVASASTKYLPQLYKNYLIKTTFGWNVWNSNLEAIACVCIMIDFILNTYNYANWTVMITSHLFWMACVILLQHIAFMVQHYLVYQKWTGLDLNEFQEITLHEKISLYEQRLEHC